MAAAQPTYVGDHGYAHFREALATAHDRNIHPSGHSFLDPCLGEGLSKAFRGSVETCQQSRDLAAQFMPLVIMFAVLGIIGFIPKKWLQRGRVPSSDPTGNVLWSRHVRTDLALSDLEDNRGASEEREADTTRVRLPDDFSRQAPSVSPADVWRRTDWKTLQVPPLTNDTTCAVCVEACDEACGDVVLRLPCGHHYHLKCIERWFVHSLEQSGTKRCPQCQADISPRPARSDALKEGARRTSAQLAFMV